MQVPDRQTMFHCLPKTCLKAVNLDAQLFDGLCSLAIEQLYNTGPGLPSHVSLSARGLSQSCKS